MANPFAAAARRVAKPVIRHVAALSGVNKWTHRAVLLGRWESWLRANQCSSAAERLDVHEVVASTGIADESISYLEFGVFRGASIQWWAKRVTNPAATFTGFDSFEGLPQAWSTEAIGTYSTAGQIPQIADARVSFVKGYFADTLPNFVATHSLSGRLVVHLDADLYSSTFVALMNIAPYLKRGDVLIFDEFHDYEHEFRALDAVLELFPIQYSAIVQARAYLHVALVVERGPADVTARARSSAGAHTEAAVLSGHVMSA